MGFAIAILTLLMVLAVTLYSLSRRTADGESVRSTFAVLRATEELMVDVSDSQLALTEFVSTGDTDLLAPYEKAQVTVPRRLERLRALTAGRAEAQQRLQDVEPLLRGALSRDLLDIKERRAGLTIEELRPMLLESKLVLDQATTILDEFKDDTVRVLTAEEDSLAKSIRRSIAIVIAGDVVLLALIVTAAGIALRDAAEKARAVQFQRRVLGIVGHDLRNPLNVVALSAAQLAKSSDGGARRPSQVSRILAATHRMEGMIRDLLDYSRLELRLALPLDLRPASIHESCTRIIEEFRAVNPSREIHYEPGEGPEVRWDPDRIEQVLANLVGNAMKYGQEGTPVRLSWRRDGETMVIEVSNQGDPIPADVRPHLFEAFRRGNAPDGQTSKSGMGLGLYIVRQIVEQHGGGIEVRSSHSEGTTFIVKLPTRPSPPEPVGRFHTSAQV
jgi:signal transduction histidine kinase